MAVHRRWGEKKRVRKSGEGNKRRTTECDSETETERWDGLTGWVFALWATLATGKPGDSTLCHSTFCQLHGKLFLEDVGFNPSGLGLFCFCVFVKRASQHSATHNALLKYITISQKALLTFLCLSILIIGFVGKKCCMHTFVSSRDEAGNCMWKKKNMLHVIFFSSLLCYTLMKPLTFMARILSQEPWLTCRYTHGDSLFLSSTQ